jgi:hypothetical protein
VFSLSFLTLHPIFDSIGDTSTEGSSRDSFLPDQTTHALADQTNSCLQEAVRRDGKSYIQHLDGFIVALREELDSPGGLSAARNQPAVEHRPYRTDVNLDGTGIESPGWFRANVDASVRERENDSMMLSRLCALHWIIVLYESVVPDVLKADVSPRVSTNFSLILVSYIVRLLPLVCSRVHRTDHPSVGG